jgi:hypothetical protein
VLDGPCDMREAPMPYIIKATPGLLDRLNGDQRLNVGLAEFAVRYDELVEAFHSHFRDADRQIENARSCQTPGSTSSRWTFRNRRTTSIGSTSSATNLYRARSTTWFGSRKCSNICGATPRMPYA